MSAAAIRPERGGDSQGVRAVLKRAFPTAAEADLVDRLRAGGDLVVSLVAERGGIDGYVAFARLTLELGGRNVPVLGLAPLAVLPERQRQGIGRALVEEGLARARDRGERLVFVLGEPGHYARFGFVPAERFASAYAGPYFQVLTLGPDAPASGRVIYPEAFAGTG